MEDEKYMKLALIEAQKSLDSGDVPIGAVIVRDGQILASSYNQKEKNNRVTDHAEIIAINDAAQKLNNYRLDGATIYTTKEPCLMCMGAILSARISKIVYGAGDYRFGTAELATNNKFNHKCEIVGGVCQEDCEKLISEFFKKLR